MSAIDPVSSRPRTVWNSSEVSTPSSAMPMCRSLSPHGELCLEVVAGGDGGHHMDRAKGVVGDHAAEGEQVARAEHLLRRDAGFATGKSDRPR